MVDTTTRLAVSMLSEEITSPRQPTDFLAANTAAPSDAFSNDDDHFEVSAHRQQVSVSLTQSISDVVNSTDSLSQFETNHNIVGSDVVIPEGSDHEIGGTTPVPAARLVLFLAPSVREDTFPYIDDSTKTNVLGADREQSIRATHSTFTPHIPDPVMDVNIIDISPDNSHLLLDERSQRLQVPVASVVISCHSPSAPDELHRVSPILEGTPQDFETMDEGAILRLLDRTNRVPGRSALSDFHAVSAVHQPRSVSHLSEETTSTVDQPTAHHKPRALNNRNRHHQDRVMSPFKNTATQDGDKCGPQEDHNTSLKPQSVIRVNNITHRVTAAPNRSQTDQVTVEDVDSDSDTEYISVPVAVVIDTPPLLRTQQGQSEECILAGKNQSAHLQLENSRLKAEIESLRADFALLSAKFSHLDIIAMTSQSTGAMSAPKRDAHHLASNPVQSSKQDAHHQRDHADH
eukprot:gene31025-38347_t